MLRYAGGPTFRGRVSPKQVEELRSSAASVDWDAALAHSNYRLTSHRAIAVVEWAGGSYKLAINEAPHDVASFFSTVDDIAFSVFGDQYEQPLLAAGGERH
mgnify:CR=1 FL=1